MKAGSRVAGFVEEAKPAIGMVVVQTVLAGVNIMYALAAKDGMKLRLIVVYRFLFATAFVLPLALVFERNKRPKLTWMVLIHAFGCGLFGGSLGQNLYLESLSLTSATYSTAMANLLPAVTFILALSFRMEKLGIGSVEGQAKVLGTLIGIGGAMILTFYKGCDIHMWSTHIDLLNRHGQHRVADNLHTASSSHTEPRSRVLGSILAIVSCLCYSLWLTIQSQMAKRYPCHYSGAALISIMGLIQSAIFALCTERDWVQWKLGWNVRLLTVAFTGIMGSGVTICLIGWCVHKRGPLFASVFSPLTLVIVALAGSLLLNEKLHLGSIIGAALIVCGLYVVLWGKRKEMEKMNQFASSKNIQEDQSTDSPSVQITVTSVTHDEKSGSPTAPECSENDSSSSSSVVKEEE